MYTVRSDVESCNYETGGDKEVTDFLGRSCILYTQTRSRRRVALRTTPPPKSPRTIDTRRLRN